MKTITNMFQNNLIFSFDLYMAKNSSRDKKLRTAAEKYMRGL